MSIQLLSKTGFNSRRLAQLELVEWGIESTGKFNRPPLSSSEWSDSEQRLYEISKYLLALHMGQVIVISLVHAFSAFPKKAPYNSSETSRFHKIFQYDFPVRRLFTKLFKLIPQNYTIKQTTLSGSWIDLTSIMSEISDISYMLSSKNENAH